MFLDLFMAPLFAAMAVEGVVGVALFAPAMLAVSYMPTARAVSLASLRLSCIFWLGVTGKRGLEVRLFLDVVVGCVFLFAGFWIEAQINANGSFFDYTQLREVGQMATNGRPVGVAVLLHLPGVNLVPAASIGHMASQFLLKREAGHFGA